ncbi:hypothetical protein Q5752_003789 [Cryptotrichosporon argae]
MGQAVNCSHHAQLDKSLGKLCGLAYEVIDDRLKRTKSFPDCTGADSELASEYEKNLVEGYTEPLRQDEHPRVFKHWRHAVHIAQDDSTYLFPMSGSCMLRPIDDADSDGADDAFHGVLAVYDYDTKRTKASILAGRDNLFAGAFSTSIHAGDTVALERPAACYDGPGPALPHRKREHNFVLPNEKDLKNVFFTGRHLVFASLVGRRTVRTSRLLSTPATFPRLSRSLAS